MGGVSDVNLWNRIEAYSLDRPGVSLPFSARLARENGWSSEFTRRVVEEYKKFIYLMRVSGEMLTPSQEVDKAWHLHLVYTRDYWLGFCRDVLGRDIHHNPTEGGAAESARYRNCYRRTKERYREEFGTMPPSDIWPDEETRFGDSGGNRPDDTSRFPFMISKSHVGIAGLLATLVVFAGWSLEEGFSSVGPVLVGIAVFFALTLLLPVGRSRRGSRKAGAGGCGGGGGGSSTGSGDCGCGGGGCGGGGD
jgi:hypothetical protein